MKNGITYLIAFIMLSGCSDEQCVSCIAQGEKSGIIIDQEITCDKSTSFIDGFIDGFTSKYKEQGDTATINCERFTDKR